MTVKELIAHLKTFDPAYPVLIWRWTEHGALVADCFVGLNQDVQKERGEVCLSGLDGTWRAHD